MQFFSVLLVICFFVGCRSSNNPTKIAADKGLELNGVESFEVKEISRSQKDESEIIQYKGSQKTQELQLTIYTQVAAAEADSFLKLRRGVIDNISKDHASAYPGPWSNEISCDPDFKPLNKTIGTRKERSLRYHLWSNSRRAFGACRKEDAHYKTLVLLMYCSANKNLFELEFYDSEEPLKLESLEKISAHCLKPGQKNS